MTSMIVNIVGASCKRADAIRQRQHEDIVKGLESGEISSGRGLNQETSLRRPDDTRWGSHHFTVLRFISMFNFVLDMLENVSEDGTSVDQKNMAERLM